MELDRTTIILLCIAFIVVWVVFKRFTQKPQQPQNPQQQRRPAAAPPGDGRFDLDKWFGRAQDVIGVMDDTRRTELEGQWREMDEERQLVLADEFLRRNGVEAEAAKLSVDERRRVGWAYYVSRLEL